MFPITATARCASPNAIAVPRDRRTSAPAGQSPGTGARGTAYRWQAPEGHCPRDKCPTRSTPVAGGLHRGGTLGQKARSVECEQDAMPSLRPGICPDDGTVRFCGVDAAVGSVLGLRGGGTLGQEARPAEREQDAMMSLPPGACPGGETERTGGVAAGVGSVPGQGARSAKPRQDPTNRETEQAQGRLPGWGLSPGKGHDPQNHDKTLRTVRRSRRRGGCRVGVCPRAGGGTIRKIRTRPYEP